MSELVESSYFNLVAYPERPPAIPSHISYTFLSKMEDCGYKFYLEEGIYSSGKKYPKLFNVPQLQGILIHKTIEHVLKYIREGQATDISQALALANPREFVRNEIVKLRKNLQINPRVDVTNLISSLSIDQIINSSKKYFFNFEFRYKKVRASKQQYTAGHSLGSEVVITIDNPPLTGILDLIVDESIVDFKTSIKHDSHAKQGRFYALLWFLKYGTAPKSFKLLYLTDKTEVDVQIPSLDDLKKFKIEISEKINDIYKQFTNGSFNPVYDFEKCKKCGVRQLCDKYWSSSYEQNFQSTDFLDVVCDFDDNSVLSPDGGLNIVNSNFSIYIDRSYFPPHPEKAKQVRILNLKRDSSESRKLRVIRSTEFFWKF